MTNVVEPWARVGQKCRWTPTYEKYVFYEVRIDAIYNEYGEPYPVLATITKVITVNNHQSAYRVRTPVRVLPSELEPLFESLPEIEDYLET